MWSLDDRDPLLGLVLRFVPGLDARLGFDRIGVRFFDLEHRVAEGRAFERTRFFELRLGLFCAGGLGQEIEVRFQAEAEIQ